MRQTFKIPLAWLKITLQQPRVTYAYITSIIYQTQSCHHYNIPRLLSSSLLKPIQAFFRRTIDKEDTQKGLLTLSAEKEWEICMIFTISNKKIQFQFSSYVSKHLSGFKNTSCHRAMSHMVHKTVCWCAVKSILLGTGINVSRPHLVLLLIAVMAGKEGHWQIPLFRCFMWLSLWFLETIQKLQKKE